MSSDIDNSKRKFGHFECSECHQTWKSAHVYCCSKEKGEFQAQECRSCKTMVKPHKVEELLGCSQCLARPCLCNEDQRECSDPDEDDYPDEDIYRDDDRYNYEDLYHDEDIYHDEDSYHDEDGYPDEDRYNDEDGYPDEDIYRFEQIWQDDDSNPDDDRYADEDDDLGQDDAKPHRADLCERCLLGKKCLISDVDQDHSVRMFGHFQCTQCKNTWSSAHVYCSKTKTGEFQAQYGQMCASCKIMNKPYRVEKLQCPLCHKRQCLCRRIADVVETKAK